MSTSRTHTPIRVVITTQDILDAHAAHGDEYMIIDIDGLRLTTYAQYGNIYIKKADGDIVHPRFWKLSGQGVTTASSIREPAKRCYAQTRVGLAQLTKVNDELVETDNMKVMKLLCETYERKMSEFKQMKIITDVKKEVRKQPDGTMRPVYLVSTKVTSPLDTTITDRETGEITDREYPYYWISLTQKRFWNADESHPESVHFNDQYYFDAEKNAPDLSKPIMTFEYQPSFYNIDGFIHHPRTGKKIYKKLGYVEEESDAEAMLDNTNIHKYLTKGSAMVGNIKFEMIITGRGAKMEFSLYGLMYVRQGVYSESDDQDDDCLDEFTSRYSKTTAKRQVDEDLEEPDLDDF
jgi:hypothetical protein